MPGSSSPQVVICGAGIAGVSVAYHLSVHHGIHDILLVDPQEPLSLTSARSTECYRNWWPGPDDAMVVLSNRSIDLLEDLADRSGNVFQLNRRGYLYLTADRDRLPAFQAAAQEPARFGAGELRLHTGSPTDTLYKPADPDAYHNQPNGADLILEPALIHQHFPYLRPGVVAALHVRRAGWFSAHELGMYLLAQARTAGIQVHRASVTAVKVADGRVQAVELNGSETIQTAAFVNAAGPYLDHIAAFYSQQLPVQHELHLKVAIPDPLDVVPRSAPLLIWTDPQYLSWSDAERREIASDSNYHWLLEQMPSGVHTRPEGGLFGNMILMLWEYHTASRTPVFPPPLDPQYPEIALRGLLPMLPGLQTYLERLPKPRLDGGYYTRTPENRPLIGPQEVAGAYILGALSGFGLMTALAAGELLASHLTGTSLPAYAAAFHPLRYQDPTYQSRLAAWGNTGQL